MDSAVGRVLRGKDKILEVVAQSSVIYNFLEAIIRRNPIQSSASIASLSPTAFYCIALTIDDR